jgi:hypothetical protein
MKSTAGAILLIFVGGLILLYCIAGAAMMRGGDVPEASSTAVLMTMFNPVTNLGIFSWLAAAMLVSGVMIAARRLFARLSRGPAAGDPHTGGRARSLPGFLRSEEEPRL